ncbi:MULTISPECIES: hypothetical protein [Vibrio]|nr:MULTISPECIES: hypothetical protein [Vibrio]MDN3696828.1 hypothetical protein [Vibrio cortegadensis]
MSQSNVYLFSVAADKKKREQEAERKERSRQRILRAAAKIKW